VKETELGNALRLFDGISRATVNLTLPDDNYFYVKPTESARASAVLTTDRTLNKSESLQVARFLCASVKGLTLENIEISDQNFNIIYSGLQEVNGGASTQYDQELLRKNEIEMKIKVSLSPLFDSVSVINDNLKFNWDKFVETSEVLSSPINGSDTGVIIKENTEKNTSTSASTGAAPGLTANDQQTNTYQTSNNTGGGASSSNAANTEYGYNRTQTTVESASGTLDTAASTIAVMVYKNRIYDEAVLRENGQLNGQSWDDFRLSLTETPLVMDFDPIQDIISKGTGLNAANISVYGYEMPVFVDSPEQTLNVTQIILFSLLGLLLAMLAFALMRGAGKNEEVTETEPELSVEALLETTRIDEEKQAERIRLQEIELDKEPEAKKLIDKFVNERPEAVAQLLRNWLNENWE
ncbi:MAG: hypothetical protein LBQ68_08935, partial [Clostridiales bacterium]|nr:hypothetical protein [Clostridiales bacterium]